MNKIKPFDVKSVAYIDFGAENNDKSPEFQISDHVRRWRFRSIFAEACNSNW